MRMMRLRVGWLLGLALGTPAGAGWAGNVQVTVQDSAGKPLAGAVVFLESREARAQAKPLSGAEIAQRNKRFEPDVTVVTVGSAVTFPNQDTVRHHVYSFSPVKTFELKLYIGTPASPVVFDKPGIAVLGCNIHDQMAAWVVIVETPYFGRSAASGQVALVGVPAGSYRLRVWHPGLAVGAPAADQALAVGAADQATVFKLAGVTP
jgi:plastocyanin